MNRDLTQFTAVVRAHQDPVFGLAMAMVRDADDAADLAQEAFLRLWRKGRHVPAAAHRAWLLRVTHNLCLDHLRSRNRHRKHVGPVDSSLLENLAAAPAVADHPLRGELDEALASLSPRARSLVVLHYGQGFKLAEVANLMDMTTGAVKVAIHRARKALKEALEPNGVLVEERQETGS